MVCLLFIPATIQIAHAFDLHQEYECCLDGFEQHFHQDGIDCELCHLQQPYEGIVYQNDFDLYYSSQLIHLTEQYNFLTHHQQLSYSLRGPPHFLT